MITPTKRRWWELALWGLCWAAVLALPFGMLLAYVGLSKLVGLGDQAEAFTRWLEE